MDSIWSDDVSGQASNASFLYDSIIACNITIIKLIAYPCHSFLFRHLNYYLFKSTHIQNEITLIEIIDDKII